MTGFARRPRFVSVLGLLVGMAMMCLALPGHAHAQGWGFLGGFFGGQPQQRAPPPEDRSYAYKPRRAHGARVPAESREAEKSKPQAPPKDASHFVLVLGDSLGQLLANGLDEALSDRPDVGVLHKARDSTGIVRADFYDWPKAVADLLTAKAKGTVKFDVAVMMIGSNDRQDIVETGQTIASDSDEWTAVYTRRVTAIAQAFRQAGVPLVWVGVPITRSGDFADDMAALNDIYRDVAAKTGAVFVDTWAAFSDGNGDFNAAGPDINGLTVRLRAADGVHFTKAGARKLAHFVEAHIRRALDRASPPATPALAIPNGGKGEPGQAESTQATTGKPAPIKPEAGPVSVITALPIAENGRLENLSALREELDRRDPLVATSLVKGEAIPPRAGRADDPSWPPR